MRSLEKRTLMLQAGDISGNSDSTARTYFEHMLFQNDLGGSLGSVIQKAGAQTVNLCATSEVCMWKYTFLLQYINAEGGFPCSEQHLYPRVLQLVGTGTAEARTTGGSTQRWRCT